MAPYMIESPHTPAECLAALDAVLAQGPELLEKFDWGCGVGEHTGWAVIMAESESAARGKVPYALRDKASVVGVTRFTPEQIKSFHK